jgi:acetyl esterase/lipase
MSTVDSPPQFADTIRNLEAGTFDVDPRTDIDTESLVGRYPELGRVVIRDVSIPGSRGVIASRLYIPEETPRAGLVWAHGGSFIGGNLDMPESNWVALALAARGFAVLSVEYTKALFGVHFPVPSIDLLEAWNWATSEPSMSSTALHLGGASAGGNLAAGVGVRLRDGQGQLPASLVLAYPLLHDLLPEASADARAMADTLPPSTRFPQDLVREIATNYAGSVHHLRDPYAFPAHADLTGMPPICILNSERDDLRASGEEFARQAMFAGVPVNVNYEPGSQHGHLNQPHSLEAQRSIDRIARWLDRDPGPARAR